VPPLAVVVVGELDDPSRATIEIEPNAYPLAAVLEKIALLLLPVGPEMKLTGPVTNVVASESGSV
jgi:hypothetical protein